MDTAVEPRDAQARRRSAFGPLLIAVGVTGLVAAGALLWSRQGAAVFGEIVLAGLAWCF